ncbi:hypothetical protein AVEN_164261-1 [Araneus ventricosus]|uniref:Uncharacterized protein n=1 Tax=Araneus ventricosus TaxID=182803 RepID=A0A4Y2N638_ARAVE|nr:hypothetical protein AVEN_164261-1 [Araneus ventricosus]
MHEPLLGAPITFRRFYFAERDTHRGGASGVFGRDRDPVRNAAPSGKIFVLRSRNGLFNYVTNMESRFPAMREDTLECTRRFLVTSRPAAGDLYKESAWMTDCVVDRLGARTSLEFYPLCELVS